MIGMCRALTEVETSAIERIVRSGASIRHPAEARAMDRVLS